MTDCVHPYDSVKKMYVQAVLDNVPQNRVTTEFCVDCGHFLSSDDSIGGDTDTPTIRIGKDNSGCDHPFDEVETKTVIIENMHDTVFIEYECECCNKCGHAVQRHEIELNDRENIA